MLAFSSGNTKRLKLLAPLLAAPVALLLNPGRAEAVLTYNIFQSGANVVVQATGSLNLTGPIVDTDQCGSAGFLQSSFANICTGPIGNIDLYAITGPSSFPGTANLPSASSVSGISTILFGKLGFAGVATGYVSGNSIFSSATFNGQTLAGLGLTTPGLLGTWSLVGGSDSIQVILGAPAPVPGPLPLLGAAAAFGWSRRMRRRISVSNTSTVA